jgi:hypothetical protein
MTRKQRRAAKVYGRPTTHVYAARAVYDEASGELPRVEMTFELSSGELVKFDMTVHELAKMIEQGMQVYNTILPPLKTSRGGWGL